MLGFNIGTYPITYLGVPIFKGKLKVNYLQPIAGKVKSKLSAWKSSTCQECRSHLGRVDLPILYLLLPTSLLNTIDEWIRNFI
jgi:hypothetical protein